MTELPRITQARFTAGATHVSQLPPPVGVEIAFAGRSNVGKSSLMNALMERKNLVRTSSTPGCTRQIACFEVAATDGSRVTLVDLPGYGYARRSKTERRQWADLIEAYLLERPTLRVVCVLVDFRRGVEEEERDLLELLRRPARVARPPLGLLVVATKLDKVSMAQRKPALARVEQQAGFKVLPFSVQDAAARAGLWRQLRRHAGVLATPEAGAVMADEAPGSAPEPPKPAADRA
ncbi:MAG: ribosome biogenesis GTP-binding protein YihA/YsxC [Polyangiaceae bacterium]|nr:ribosome biogenesis GTP-binding protein YihA/YsxC [Polyangiaceae bacterium]MCW5790922.1 ribosome biogenesis GTP-binding protein YihA/YsxC [Polyangiaceae bacterium]